MTVAQLKYFIEVVRHSSITEAAERLYISQPALSRQIINMEQELQIPLFNRSGNTLRLTPAGKEFYEGAVKIVRDYEAVCSNANRISNGMKGVLHLSVLEDQQLSPRLIKAIGKFHEQYPLVQIALKWMTFPAIHQGLMDGTVDFAFTFLHNEEFTPNIRVLDAQVEDVYLMVTKAFEYPEGKSISPEELPELSKRFPFLALTADNFERGSRISNLVQKAEDEKAEEGMVRALYVSSGYERTLYVVTGLGMAVQNESSYLALDAKVRCIPIEDCAPIERVLCYNNNIPSAVKSQFIEFYRNMLQEERDTE